MAKLGCINVELIRNKKNVYFKGDFIFRIMATLRGIIQHAFDQDFPYLEMHGVRITPETANMPWELWVRTYLGNFLDVLPQNPEFDLEEYMIDMAEDVAINIYTDSTHIQQFNADFRMILDENFPQEKIPDYTDVKKFLTMYLTDDREHLKALVLVYAYHRRRQVAVPEEAHPAWPSDDSSVPSSPVLPPIPVVLPPVPTLKKEYEEYILQTRQEFSEKISIMMRGVIRWTDAQMADAFKGLEETWEKLDPYSQTDLLPLYTFVQQYKKTI
jgi:hypothetical protein